MKDHTRIQTNRKRRGVRPRDRAHFLAAIRPRVVGSLRAAVGIHQRKMAGLMQNVTGIQQASGVDHQPARFDADARQKGSLLDGSEARRQADPHQKFDNRARHVQKVA